MIGSSGPPRRSSSAGTLGLMRFFGTHRASFSPPDLCRWFLGGKLTRNDTIALEGFAQQFASTALLIEIGDSVSLDHDVQQTWLDQNIGLAVDRPTVLYGHGGGRIALELAIAGIEDKLKFPRRFAVAFCDNERDAVQALIHLRTARAKDSLVPRS